MTVYRGQWLVHNERKTPPAVVVVASREAAFRRVGLKASQYPRPELDERGCHPAYVGQGVKIYPWIERANEGHPLFGAACEIAVYQIPL